MIQHTAHEPNYAEDKVGDETMKEFQQRVRLETQAENERVQREHNQPKVVYVEKVVFEEVEIKPAEITQEAKDEIIAEWKEAEKQRKAAERKAKAEAKLSQ